MNGFVMMADSYKSAVKQGTFKEEEVASKIRLYEFLGTCGGDDFFDLFNSSAFNEIMMSYIRKAVQELVDEEVLDDDQAMAVRNRVNTLLSEQTAKEICEG